MGDGGATVNGLAELLGALAAAYPNPAPTPERMRAYMLALGDLGGLPSATYVRAFRAITRTERQFFPPPGVIRQALAPKPTAAELASLYGRIEGLVITARYDQRGAIYELVEERFGATARAAFIAAGGVEAVHAEDGREFRLRDFREAYLEELESPRALIGSMDDRLRELVSTTAHRLASHTPRLPGSR